MPSPKEENTLLLTEEDMDTLLNYKVDETERQMYKQTYENTLSLEEVDMEAKFHYAWSLTHGSNYHDFKEASVLLEDIFKEGSEEIKRDSLFCLIIAETKLKHYCKAKKYADAFLSVEESNVQAQQLKAYIESHLEKDSIKGMALAGTAAVVGGAAAIAVGTLVVGAAISFAIGRKMYRG